MDRTRHAISIEVVHEAFRRVKANKGAAGIDRQSIEEFESNLQGNLYKTWNRMSAGSYFPSPTRLVDIPKEDGGTRTLGIPTVADRVAQMVAMMELEPLMEPHFHSDLYAYRPNKSAVQAVGMVRQRNWQYDWVIDLDIRKFFDSIDHNLMMKAVRKHTNKKWVLLYIERWLKAPGIDGNGKVQERQKGTPQGAVISPLLANLFLHYALDMWMEKTYPTTKFVRYADDIIVHCTTNAEAQQLLRAIEQRLEQCKLELHPEKSRIVYCKDGKRKKEYPIISYDFLGHTFRQRLTRSREGECFMSMLPGVSKNAEKRMTSVIRSWKLKSQLHKSLREIAEKVNPVIRGWINYFGKYAKSTLSKIAHNLDHYIAEWLRKKYANLTKRKKKAFELLKKIKNQNRKLFTYWNMY